MRWMDSIKEVAVLSFQDLSKAINNKSLIRASIRRNSTAHNTLVKAWDSFSKPVFMMDCGISPCQKVTFSVPALCEFILQGAMWQYRSTMVLPQKAILGNSHQVLNHIVPQGVFFTSHKFIS